MLTLSHFLTFSLTLFLSCSPPLCIDNSKAGRGFAIFWVSLGTLVIAKTLGGFADMYLENRQRELNERLLNQKITVEDLYEMDDSNDHMVNEVEFITFYLVKMGKVQKGEIERMRKRFIELDADGSGTLTMQEVEALWRQESFRH